MLSTTIHVSLVGHTVFIYNCNLKEDIFFNATLKIFENVINNIFKELGDTYVQHICATMSFDV